MEPSKYQKAIFDFITNNTSSAVIEAVAGSGKTTTVVNSLNLIPAEKSVLMLAFNKSIADELKNRVPAHVDVKTFNGLGHSILGSRLGRVNLDTYKMRNILKDTMDSFDYKEFGDIVFQLTGYARRLGLLPSEIRGVPLIEDTKENWIKIIDHFGMPIENSMLDVVLFYAKAAIIKSVNMAADKKVIDFDDQIYIPAIKNMRGNAYDFVFVDEAQDVSPVRTKLIQLVLKEDTGRVIAVGDSCQPLGTQVNVPIKSNRWNKESPKTVNIEDLKVGDKVVSYTTSDVAFYTSGKTINGITRREFSGDLIVVTTDNGIVTKYTPNHHCFVNFSGLRDKYSVYLMKKGNQFRIGKAAMSYNGATGISARMHSEKADCAWILDVFDTENEAFFWEQAISGKFGIPQLMFSSKKMTRNDSDTLLPKVWEYIGENYTNALLVLESFGRDIRYPLFTIGTNKQQTIKRPIITRACNLINGVKVLPYDGNSHTNKNNWVGITVTKEHYNGDVISLDVEDTHLYIGDSIVTHNCQAIYGFTGSDAQAMNTLRDTFNAVSLPLSISYRCAKNIVNEAKSVMPTIEASDTAPDGEVIHLDKFDHNTFNAGDMIICRKNAPIVSLCFKLISNGIPARVMGRDISSGLVKLIEKLKAKGLEGKHGLRDKLIAWENKEVTKWVEEDRPDMVETIKDKVSCIFAVLERTSVNTVPDLIRSIESMFSDDTTNTKSVTLSSIHKSKGLESDTVYFLDIGIIPLKSARQEWQLEQENNLKYVGITRAKRKLVFINSEM